MPAKMNCSVGVTVNPVGTLMLFTVRGADPQL